MIAAFATKAFPVYFPAETTETTMGINNTLGERVHEIIRQDIIAGRYNPGERLFFEVIAKEIGVSMTPVKEAFMLLEREGLVVTAARKGTFVRELSKRDVQEYCQVRLALESLAVDLICAGGLGSEDERELRRVCDDMERHIAQKDAVGCIMDDVLYHRHLVIAGRNSQLVRLIGTLPLTNLYNMVRKTPYYLQHGEAFLGEHKQFIELLRKKEAAQAKELLEKHITAGKHSIFVAMDS